MNKQGNNKIDWTDYTWNPITGCLNGCEYCYARKIYERFGKSFKPEIHQDRLKQPLKESKPSKIFVCSVSDFFGEGVPQEWREEVYNIIKDCPQHTFQLLTKQPQNITEYDLSNMPENIWLGVTSTGYYRDLRDYDLSIFMQFKGVKFISYEPMLGMMQYIPGFIDWVILGTIRGKKVRENHYNTWIRLVVSRKDEYKIFMKESIKPYWQGKLIKEFPTKKEEL